MKTKQSVSHERVNAPRPTNATHDGLRKCLKWLDACRELGWAEDVMPDFEGLFWKYHDPDGNKRQTA